MLFANLHNFILWHFNVHTVFAVFTAHAPISAHQLGPDSNGREERLIPHEIKCFFFFVCI